MSRETTMKLVLVSSSIDENGNVTVRFKRPNAWSYIDVECGRVDDWTLMEMGKTAVQGIRNNEERISEELKLAQNRRYAIQQAAL